MEGVAFPRITLVWHDAHTGYSTSWWHPGEEVEEDPAIIHSTGWLVEPSHKPDHWMLAQSFSPKDGALGECLFIPKAMVVDQYLLFPSPLKRRQWTAVQAWLRNRFWWW